MACGSTSPRSSCGINGRRDGWGEDPAGFQRKQEM